MSFKRNLFLLLLIPLAFAIVACNHDDDDDDLMDEGSGDPPAAMVGTWIFQSVTVDGEAADLSEVLEWVQDTVEARVHIQSNSAYVYEEVNSSGGQLWFESGFVFIDGDEMDINAQLDGDGSVNETTRVAFVLSKGMLTLTEVDEGMTVVFVLTN